MTQRTDLATVMDRLAIDDLVTDYARALDEGDWDALRRLFVPGGRADHRSAGGITGDVHEVTAWLAGTLDAYPLRQHLVLNRQLRFADPERDEREAARLRADYLTVLGAAPDGRGVAPDVECGGRYAFALVRTVDGWRLGEVVVQELWRRNRVDGVPGGTP
ncbi:nuclear transport factor 2 family protein [Streptomyces sp. NPDC127068]|uniref:nuclear transport factor 2 family protein n=1 Tax=Streptomyces sp. NPDC127068 TaxID=3347127 RepID=UPI0036517B2D